MRLCVLFALLVAAQVATADELCWDGGEVRAETYLVMVSGIEFITDGYGPIENICIDIPELIRPYRWDVSAIGIGVTIPSANGPLLKRILGCEVFDYNDDGAVGMDDVSLGLECLGAY